MYVIVSDHTIMIIWVMKFFLYSTVLLCILATILKILQQFFNNTWTLNFQMFKLVLEKAEEPEIKLPTSAESLKKQESSRKTFPKHQFFVTQLYLYSISPMHTWPLEKP